MIRRYALGVVLVLAACIMFTYHPIFRLAGVDIEHGQFTHIKDLHDYFDQYAQQNVFLVRYHWDLKHDMLTHFPTLKDVSFSIGEGKRLIVDVIEKTPWIMVMDKGTIYLVAKDGTVLAHQADFLDVDDYQRLIVVKGVPSEVLAQSQLSPALLDVINQVITGVRVQFPDRTFQILLDDVEVVDGQVALVRNVSLIQDDFIPILLGTIDQLDNKWLGLKTFYDRVELTKKDIEYVDLRVDGRVYVKYGRSS